MKLPALTRDVEQGKRDMDEYGLCVHESFIGGDELKRAEGAPGRAGRAGMRTRRGAAQRQSRGGKTWYGHPEPGHDAGLARHRRRSTTRAGCSSTTVAPAVRGLRRARVPRQLVPPVGDDRPDRAPRRRADGRARRPAVHAVHRGADLPELHAVPDRVRRGDGRDARRAASRISGRTRSRPSTPKRGAYNPEPIDTVAVEAPAGSVIFFESRTWHQSGISHSDKTRYSLTTLWQQSLGQADGQHRREPARRGVPIAEPGELEMLGFKAEPSGRIEAR